ncbi:MAG: hypothetical protein ACFBSD_00330 [Paracoccaceae bacterium]
MTIGRLRLERFDPSEAEDEPSATDLGPDFPPDTPVDVPPMAPAPTPPHAEAETAQPTVAAPCAIERLTELLNEIVASLGDARAEAETRSAEAMVRAAEKALPALVESGFPAEVGAASLALLRRGAPVPVTLRISPADNLSLRSALEEATLPDGLTICEDPTLTPGQARLGWEDGGADLDAERLTKAALAALDTALRPQRIEVKR